MPPVAVFGLSDANGRHRGDGLAGTVVVIRINDEAGDDERDDGSEAESDQGAVDETGSDEESGEHSKEERGGGESDDG